MTVGIVIVSLDRRRRLSPQIRLNLGRTAVLPYRYRSVLWPRPWNVDSGPWTCPNPSKFNNSPLDLSASFPIDGGTVRPKKCREHIQKPQCFDGFRSTNFEKNRTVLFASKKFTFFHEKTRKIQKNSRFNPITVGVDVRRL